MSALGLGCVKTQRRAKPIIRYIGGQGSKLSDVCLAPKATDNRLQTARREGPEATVMQRSNFPSFTYSDRLVAGGLQVGRYPAQRSRPLHRQHDALAELARRRFA